LGEELMSEHSHEEGKQKREEKEPREMGLACSMCGGGKMMWVLWVIIAALIVLAFLR